jgi:hypothetical protein
LNNPAHSAIVIDRSAKFACNVWHPLPGVESKHAWHGLKKIASEPGAIGRRPWIHQPSGWLPHEFTREHPCLLFLGNFGMLDASDDHGLHQNSPSQFANKWLDLIGLV